MWNIVDVKPPPNLSYEIQGSLIGADGLSSICTEAISVLCNLNELHAEAALLSRVLYRTKSKMRNDKGIMYMAKVNHSLLQYLSMDLKSAFSDLNPSEEDEIGRVCVPSRQMLEWTLVRTQGFTQLFSHIMRACQNAAYYLKCRIHLGHIWDLALLYLGAASRIWTISKYLVLESCKWYKKLKSYHRILKPIGLPWLPTSYEFPEDLKTWLDFPLLTKPICPRYGKETTQFSIFNLLEDLDEESFTIEKNENSVMSTHITDFAANEDNELNAEVSGKDSNNDNNEFLSQKQKSFSEIDDIGEPLVRDELSSLLPSSLKFDENVARQKNNNNHKSSKNKNSEVSTVSMHSASVCDKNRTQYQKKNRKYVEDKCSKKDIKTVKTFPSKHQLIIKGKKIQKKDAAVIESEHKKNKKAIKENICSSNVQTSKVSNLKQTVKAIKSVNDLKKFIIKELKLRKNESSECFTNSMDKMQWNMFKNAMKNHIIRLSSKDVPKGSDEFKRTLKKARKEILLHIQ